MKRLFNALIIGIVLLSAANTAFASVGVKIVIHGLEGAELKNANSRISTLLTYYRQNGDQSNVTDIAKRGPEEIKQALQPFGYYKATVRVSSGYAEDKRVYTYTVTKGPALRITHLSVNVVGEGRNNYKIHVASNAIPLKANQVLTTIDYEKAKSDLLNAANGEGYIKANFSKASIVIDLKTYQSTVTLSLDTGRRYYFGNTLFEPSEYASAFLYRFLNYHVGEPYNSDKVANLEQSMSESSYFDTVSIAPHIEQANDQSVPITIQTSLPKSQRYTMSLGYGTFTGPRIATGVSFRRVTNTGQHFDMNLQLASVLSIFSAKYYIPGSNPLTDNWLFGTDYKVFDPKNGQSESVSALFGFIKTVKRIRTSLTMNYLRERFDVQKEPERHSHLLYPNLTLSYVKTDDPVDPTYGYSFNVMAQGASDRIFSTNSFAQTDIKGKVLVSPLSFAKIIVRAEVGYTVVEDLNRLPLTMRFYAGGMNSIRGFPDSSIGPGRYLQTGSIEYQNKLYGQLYGAVFYDIGAASNHFGTPVNKGVGVGLVYYTVVGPVKIYLGRAISKKSQPYDIEFSLGPEF